MEGLYPVIFIINLFESIHYTTRNQTFRKLLYISIVFQEEQKVSHDTRYLKRGIASPLSTHNDSCTTNISFSANAGAEVGNSGTKTRLQNLRLDAFDKLSVKIGSTLRRYPILRIFILFYMVSVTIFDQTSERSVKLLNI